MKTQKEEVKLGRPARSLCFPSRNFTVAMFAAAIQRTKTPLTKVQINNRIKTSLLNGELVVVEMKRLARGRPQRILSVTKPEVRKALAAKARRSETLRLKAKTTKSEMVTA